jgi:hypothetical protein
MPRTPRSSGGLDTARKSYPERRGPPLTARRRGVGGSLVAGLERSRRVASWLQRPGSPLSTRFLGRFDPGKYEHPLSERRNRNRAVATSARRRASTPAQRTCEVARHFGATVPTCLTTPEAEDFVLPRDAEVSEEPGGRDDGHCACSSSARKPRRAFTGGTWDRMRNGSGRRSSRSCVTGAPRGTGRSVRRVRRVRTARSAPVARTLRMRRRRAAIGRGRP